MAGTESSINTNITIRPPNLSVQMPSGTRMSEPESTGTAIRMPVCVSFRPSCSCTFTPTIASIIQIMKQTVKANVLKISTE